MTTHFFFDLEGTVIDNFWNKEFAVNNSTALRHVLNQENPATLNVFSFAMHDNEDLAEFEAELRKPLETFFGMLFTLVHTVPQIQSMLGHCLEATFSLQDVLKMGKWNAFQTLVLKTNHFRFGGTENIRCVLFDDMVDDVISTRRMGNIVAESVDVWKLAAEHSHLFPR